MEKQFLVLATTNRGKTAEFCKLLQGFAVEIKDLHDFGSLPKVVEDGKTFEENAYKKASFYARILGIPVIADDSGLVVDALAGAPGVRSARYSGEFSTDSGNNARLLCEMKDNYNRKAAFECVLSIAVPTGLALTYEATCKGEIALEPRGENGFGYDPLFFYPPLNKTFGEMSIDEKTKVSHRGKAVTELISEFDKVFLWLKQKTKKIRENNH
ncbi:MAG: XTP/dITP diphosphatase [Pseudomonadota bacterium]